MKIYFKWFSVTNSSNERNAVFESGNIWPTQLYCLLSSLHYYSELHTSIDLWLCAWSLNERQVYEGQLHKEMVVSGSFYQFFGIRSATWFHTIYAWDSSPHLPITPTQQMRPGIGQNVSWAVGNFNITSRPFFFLREMWSVDCSCIVCSCVVLEQQATGPQQADRVLQYF